MLSTSILYCNKLDDSALLQQGTRATGAIGCSVSSNCDTTGPDCHFESLASENKYHHHHPSASETNSAAARLVLKSACEPSAVSVCSENTIATNRSVAPLSASSRYRVRYLGCNTCDPRTHRLDHGIAAYQKPLLDLYSAVLRRSVVLRSLYSSLSVINQVADMSRHGIVIAERDRFGGRQSGATPKLPTVSRPHSSASGITSVASSFSPQPQQPQPPPPHPESIETVVTKVITPLSNILLWAAVKFQHRPNVKKSRGRTAKRHQIGVAFVPLSCSEAVLDKNTYVALNSKQRFLLGLPHPPLFVCVLQRVNSGQRLECHLFVCVTADDAIRMCARMTELRQQTCNISRLQAPLPGQMGSYSYRSGSASSSHVTAQSRPTSLASRSSNYAFSDHSTSFGAKSLHQNYLPNHHHHLYHHHHHANDKHDEREESRRANGRKLAENNIHSDASAVIPAIKYVTSDIERKSELVPSVINSSNISSRVAVDHQRQVSHKFAHNLSSGNDSLSWIELSSLSSAIISTKSEPNNKLAASAKATAAQRDYRFQAYKCPQNFVLPELNTATKEVLVNKLAATDKSAVAVTTTTAATKRIVDAPLKAESDDKSGSAVKWSTVSEELQNNRLFARASAIASNGSAESQSQSPSDGLPSKQLRKLVDLEKDKDQISLTDSIGENRNSNRSSTKRFFGDTLRTSKGMCQILANVNDQESKIKATDRQAKTSAEQQNGDKSQIDSRNLDGKMQLKNRMLFASANHTPNNQLPHQKFSNDISKSTISNSIFFDNEDDCKAENLSLEKFIDENDKSSYFPNRISTHASSNNCEISNYLSENNQSKRINLLTKTKSESNILGESNKRPTIETTKSGVTKVPPLTLYLSEQGKNMGSNVGVKCFNKNTPVNRWSTMATMSTETKMYNSSSSNNSQRQIDDYRYYGPRTMSNSCEECCNLCQYETRNNDDERQILSRHSSCPDCVTSNGDNDNDDEQNFNESDDIFFQGLNIGHANYIQPTATTCRRSLVDSSLSSADKNENFRQPKRQEHDDNDRLEAINSKHARHRKQISLLGRLRQFGSSIFGGNSRKLSGSRSRLWPGFRLSSQRLKGSKRYARQQKTNVTCRPLNRIFLPEPVEEQFRVYGEQYLKPPKMFANGLQQNYNNNNNNKLYKALNDKNEQSLQQLSTAVKNVKLSESSNVNKSTTTTNGGKRDGREEFLRSIKNGTSGSGSNDNNSEKLLNEKQIHRIEAKSDSAKPFFLSHPASWKQPPDVLAPHEFLTSQVLSLSSDSGMEENDCYSSTENRPSSRLQKPTNAHDFERSNGRLTNGSITGVKTATGVGAINRKQTSAKSTAKTNVDYHQAALNARHRQGANWSGTNLESELGYMP